MIIGGLQRLSLSDFPGKISAIIFTRGCGFRCRYCHNPELVDPDRYVLPILEEDVVAFLRARRGLLDGVVVTGGEPTFHEDLPRFLGEVKSLGFAVKLDTNGSSAAQLEALIAGRLVDFVALDVKAPFPSYARVAGTDADPESVRRSIGAVIGSGLPHEMRTTWCRSLLSLEDMKEIAAQVRGCSALVVQGFRPTAALDPAMLAEPAPSPDEIAMLCAEIESTGVRCVPR
jgi:pyruvate formate lyase activating enzyme